MRQLMRGFAGTAAALLALVVLTACGGDDDGGDPDTGADYCAVLEEKSADLENLSPTDENFDVSETLSAFEELRASAPEDLQDDYATVIDAIEAIQSGDIASVDQQKFQEAITTLQERSKTECKDFVN